MQYRNIPYEYDEWTAYGGKKCKAYTCKYFNFYPYHKISFSTNTEAEMINAKTSGYNLRQSHEKLLKFDIEALLYNP